MPETGPVRRPAVAGRWYPDSPAVLAATVDAALAAAPGATGLDEIVALIAPHAGLMYSGSVAAHAYRSIGQRRFDVAVLVGPSHYLAFDGVAVYPRGGFGTPLGLVEIDAECAAAMLAAQPLLHEGAAAHAREHSLEMQLPFLCRVAPDTKIVPLVMGSQDDRTARALADAVAGAVGGRRALLVASTDLSHYHDARTAAALDAVVIEQVARLDPDGLQQALDREPGHACGGGPAVAVMRAAQRLGARDAAILKYADSGDVSGDKTSVVGYLAAALGRVHTARGSRNA